MADAELFDRLCLRLGICDEGVEGDDCGNAEFLDIFNMFLEVHDTLLQSLDILFLEVCFGNASVVLKGLDAGDDDDCVRMKLRHAALDIQELLSAQISAESRLGDRVVGDLESRPGRADRVAAVSDVGEGAAVNKSGSVLDGLDEVGGDGFLEKGHHGTGHLQGLCQNRLTLVIVSDHDAVKAPAEIFSVCGKAQDSHDLGSGGDDEAVLAERSVHLCAHADDDVAQSAVVHIHAALPDDSGGIDPEHVSVMDVVINSCRQQVVGGCDGMEIASEMQVEFLHGKDLGIAAACRSALDAEAGSQRGLTQGEHDILSKLVESVRHTDTGGRLSFSRGSGVDGSHKDQFPVRT